MIERRQYFVAKTPAGAQFAQISQEIVGNPLVNRVVRIVLFHNAIPFSSCSDNGGIKSLPFQNTLGVTG